MAAAENILHDLVFVDLETTGADPAYDRVTEVGLVRVRDGELVEEWSSLVNPERPIPAYIEAMTSISDEMVAGAPRFADIAALVRQKLDGAVFVAHNARFDYSFLRSEFRMLDMPFSAQVLCTVKLSRRLFPEFARHNLDAVMERHGLSCSARHRALGDAQVLHEFWRKLKQDVAPPTLAATVQAEQQTAPERLFVRVLGPGVDAVVLSNPDGWDPAKLEIVSAQLDDGTLVQVGKSTEAREDLLARFRAALGLVTLLIIIVALTGGASRLVDAVDLLASGRGRRLLISGVAPTTNATDLMRRVLQPVGVDVNDANIGHSLRQRQCRRTPET